MLSRIHTVTPGGTSWASKEEIQLEGCSRVDCRREHSLGMAVRIEDRGEELGRGPRVPVGLGGETEGIPSIYEGAGEG